MEKDKMPVGLMMALAQNPDTMVKFSNLSDTRKQEIIDGTHQISSKEEMLQYVNKILSL